MVAHNYHNKNNSLSKKLNSSPIDEFGIRCHKVDMLDAQIPAQGSNHDNPATVYHPTPVTLKTQWKYLHQYLPTPILTIRGQRMGAIIRKDQPIHKSKQLMIRNDQQEATKHMEPLPTQGQPRIISDIRERPLASIVSRLT